MNLFELLVLGFAVHRIVSVWSTEQIMRALREWTLRTPLGYLTSCPLCVSVWAAAGAWTLWKHAGFVGESVIYIIALSEVSILIEFGLRRLLKGA